MNITFPGKTKFQIKYIEGYMELTREVEAIKPFMLSCRDSMQGKICWFWFRIDIIKNLLSTVHLYHCGVEIREQREISCKACLDQVSFIEQTYYLPPSWVLVLLLKKDQHVDIQKKNYCGVLTDSFTRSDIVSTQLFSVFKPETS